MDSIKITTGEKHIVIERDGVSVGEIRFNPTDVLFAERFYHAMNETQSKVTQYGSKIEALPRDDKGLPVDMGEGLKLLHETCDEIKVMIDSVFGPGTSQLVFGDTLNLDMFPQFFDGFAPFFKSARAEKIQPYLVKPNGNGHKKTSKPRKRK